MASAAQVPPSTPLDVANRLRPVLLHLNRHLRREAHAQGLSTGQISMLAAIQQQPGIGVGDLAGLEGMSSPAVCGHIDRLEAAGYVCRTRGSEHDRRRVELSVTPAGARLLRTVRSRRTAWLAAQLETLDREQRRAVEAAIEPLASLVRSA